MLFLAGLAILHGIKIQNRFSGILGFTKIMMLCWLIAELLRLSTWQAISAGKLTWFAGMSGAITVISLLVIALLRLRFPYPEQPETTQTPVLNHCPSCGIKLQRQYNPNACPSCGAVLKCAGLIGFRSVKPLTFIRSGANQLNATMRQRTDFIESMRKHLRCGQQTDRRILRIALIIRAMLSPSSTVSALNSSAEGFSDSSSAQNSEALRDRNVRIHRNCVAMPFENPVHVLNIIVDKVLIQPEIEMTPTLNGKRILLRPLTIEDAPAIQSQFHTGTLSRISAPKSLGLTQKMAHINF